MRPVCIDAEFVPERVAALDPLSAANACARLPELNARRDVPAITATLSALLPAPPVLAGLSYHECLAAMRDLGMFLASLQRHGVQPIEVVPHAEPVLVELGRRTDMIPRETIHHYTEMNPTGDRQRTLTGDPQESAAIEVVRIAMRRYGAAIGLAERLAGARPDQPEFPLLLTELAGELDAFAAAMDLAHERLTPEFFYGELLPYFDEIDVGTGRYFGPTAAHVPLAVIDTLVWESDHGSGELAEYREWALPYTMPRWRALRVRWLAVPSLTTRVRAALTGPGAHDATVHDSAAALTTVLHALLLFRGKHVAYARKGGRAEGVALLRDIIKQNKSMIGFVTGQRPLVYPDLAIPGNA
ncbi:MAG TPA: monodechloroaminopyrrolnitrin synthase PrnB family protein [Actinophytocola sp.]|uniref:monodechloroaminopyrrolnitrin synthase PrnB family protein n=1 Tax=Actinophytocola sp. TaxID=1872138 RepID=UPI002DBB50DF|nr:monodechloroaminopyrrolnitrin synthase PrnB family protein [Actinophytocola sp.]HEU5473340.1 monodechloroaminopyrrolnitrin synthase PrnB family protein [Actinophytocola sp.]